MLPRPAQARALSRREADDRIRRLAAALSALSVLALGAALLAGVAGGP